MSVKHHELKARLVELEKLLRDSQLWSITAPPAQALASDQPFAWDTLSFDQWLQFVFIPKLLAIVASQASLPTNSSVASMAEEFFASALFSPSSGAGAEVVRVLRSIDALLAGNH
ncbi:MAG: YqcC family protein [Porticoccaceae bacterium]|nr:YqcC family protein [Porticoccaceae bacterium]